METEIFAVLFGDHCMATYNRQYSPKWTVSTCALYYVLIIFQSKKNMQCFKSSRTHKPAKITKGRNGSESRGPVIQRSSFPGPCNWLIWAPLSSLSLAHPLGAMPGSMWQPKGRKPVERAKRLDKGLPHSQELAALPLCLPGQGSGLLKKMKMEQQTKELSLCFQRQWWCYPGCQCWPKKKGSIQQKGNMFGKGVVQGLGTQLSW